MNALASVCPRKDCCRKQLHIVQEAAIILNRYLRVKGFMAHNSPENMNVITTIFHASLKVPRPRKYYKGTAAPTMIC